MFVWASVFAASAYAVREALRIKSPGLVTVLCWMLLPYLFFSAITTKIYAYVCVAVPAVCLLWGFCAASLWAARDGVAVRPSSECCLPWARRQVSLPVSGYARIMGRVPGTICTTIPPSAARCSRSAACRAGRSSSTSATPSRRRR